MKRLLPVILFVAGIVQWQGCFLVPAYDSFKKAGMTESDRKELLPQALKGFRDALYWGSPGEALTFVTEDQREKMRPELRVNREEERVVDSRVEDVSFSDAARAADVEVTVRYYKVPYYVVRDRREKQQWKFTISDGWKLASRTVLDAG